MTTPAETAQATTAILESGASIQVVIARAPTDGPDLARSDLLRTQLAFYRAQFALERERAQQLRVDSLTGQMGGLQNEIMSMRAQVPPMQ